MLIVVTFGRLVCLSVRITLQWDFRRHLMLGKDRFLPVYMHYHLVTPTLKMKYVALVTYLQNMSPKPYLCQIRDQFLPNDGAKKVRNFQCVLHFSFFVFLVFSQIHSKFVSFEALVLDA